MPSSQTLSHRPCREERLKSFASKAMRKRGYSWKRPLGGTQVTISISNRKTGNERMHGNPVKRNGGRESVTRQFAKPQAVVVGNPEKISGGTWQVSATALPPFVFYQRQFERPQKGHGGRFFHALESCQRLLRKRSDTEREQARFLRSETRQGHKERK